MKKIDKKDVCPHCGNKRDFHPWVFAHWNEPLTTTCTKCGKKYYMQSGKVSKNEF